MLSVREITIAMFGAWRILRLDAGALAWFENTPTAFWRSFYAGLLVAPLYLLMMAVDIGIAEPDEPVRQILVNLIAYVIGWVAYPLLMVYLTAFLDRAGDYFRYFAAYNWFHVIQAMILLPASLAGSVGPLPENVSLLIGIVVLSTILMYDWFIARVALRVDGGTAASLVVVDLLLSLLISGMADSLA